MAGILVTGAIGSVLAFAGPASASGRPCGPGVSTNGVGTLGSPYTLKSKHDDDGPGGSLVVGEEFEIKVPLGQVWQVTFADNGNTYPASSATTTGPASVTLTCSGGNQKINISSGNQLTYTLVSAGNYTVVTKAGGQGDKTYTYTSSTGQIVGS